MSRRPQAVAAQYVADRGGGHDDTELGQLALYAHVAPPAVLSGQAHDELCRDWVEWRPARSSVWIGPASANGVAMPAQHCGRSDQERRPPRARQEAPEQGQQSPVSWLELRLFHLAAKHVELVTEDQDLDVLVGVGHSPPPKDLDEPNGEPVEE